MSPTETLDTINQQLEAMIVMMQNLLQEVDGEDLNQVASGFLPPGNNGDRSVSSNTGFVER